MHTPSGAEEIALFDLDGVLIRGDTMTSLVIRRLNRLPWLYLAAAPLAITAVVVSSTGGWRPRLHRALVRLALHGLSPAAYDELVADAVPRLRSRADRDLVNLATSLSGSVRTIVATASEEKLATAFLDAVGLRDVEIVGSSLIFSPRNRVKIGAHNVGVHKVASLELLGIDLATATFYTDSASDLPLILATRRTFLVRASARSQRIIRAQTGPEDGTLRRRIQPFPR